MLDVIRCQTENKVTNILLFSTCLSRSSASLSFCIASLKMLQHVKMLQYVSQSIASQYIQLELANTNTNTNTNSECKNVLPLFGLGLLHQRAMLCALVVSMQLPIKGTLGWVGLGLSLRIGFSLVYPGLGWFWFEFWVWFGLPWIGLGLLRSEF